VHQSPGADQGFDCVELQRCRWGDYGVASQFHVAQLAVSGFGTESP